MHKRSRLELNPIIVMDLRSRMRGGRAFLTLTSALATLGIFSYALYRLVLSSATYSPTPISPQIGQILFAGLAYLELLMIGIITPAVTAGAISNEKEKLTYEMLLATPLHPASILWGKLLSNLSYIFLLIFAAIPLFSLVFVFGGVAMRDMIKALVILSSTAIMFGVLGLFLSALLGRTGRATVSAYLAVLMISLAPLLISIGYSVLNQGQPPRWLLIPSPVSALASAISPSMAPQALMSRFWIFSGPWGFSQPPISLFSIPRPIYHYTLPLYGTVTIILYLITTRLVLLTRRWRFHWAEVLTALIILLGFAGIVGLAFFSTAGRYENITITEEGPAEFTDTQQQLVP